MAEVIRMPLLSDTMTEGVIAEWLKKVGDTVKSGDILAEVETDKATMELENYADGTLLYVAADKGQAIEVNGVLAVVGKPGEDYQSLLDGEGGSSNGAAAETKAEPAPAEQPKTTEEPKKAEAPKAAVDLSSIKATAVRMPLLSDTMTEGVIANWVVNVGDKVKSGDILAEVETDKATMELENYDDGVLLYIGVEAGKAAQVNQIIAIVGEEGANFQAILDAENGTSSAPAEAKEEAPAASVNGSSAEASQSSDAEGRIKASPLAKSIAKDKGINLSDVTGSGENGRIVKKDLDTFTPAAKEAPSPAAAATPAAKPAAAAPAPKPAAVPEPVGEYEDLPVTSMRKTIARRLSESLYTAPHFYLTMEITMDNAMKFRGQVNEVSPAKISFNDFAIKAAALALKQHPAVNASWLGDKIRRYKYINIGVAVAVEDGLVVPVVRNADQKTLSTISTEVKDYAGKAKSKKLQPKEMEGSTFSISNLGMFGVEEFNPIINSPDSCILAVGGIKKTVGVNDAGEFFVTNIMKVTLACDHRAVDGATGAAFLQTFKQLIEDPMRMLV
ncbi:pyruvate dehydrogenase complex dihydrolipoamide acetyltransferase [Siphonobacter sp. SORGH_AS_0500]|uniref:pyruvate dehydrogenase complex dihydrolipoamide acetyltransferase n=1 Tax=Siphonobacter sp. SORGH_AS_0500 TaxID=1864824 RepID=UPI00286218BC|nr:pyruvate dehydrogenase complex dihydrolipoamide acetyltransferase [Siphonobacter sp. SORGH_AS_0500]MDR6195483.1 pyruvate dehydrogenase E2 component (dihydrolipoamide acetyltransferase) [Siphonobacter sp. SORGH_AS_0500]